ncbi:MAG TPA: hypothetical protein IAB98_11605 [Candidatus Egerieimonas intestinavium]|uniref:DUF2953 domain-containing protein n=1 Tax=Candidatus Egerieimonas intestinavium TaxID=2840777 RepID=A0A9D1EL96_9FIRM|nr:hypothetical protein [Candidatus Egerieimonas intestinavium]
MVHIILTILKIIGIFLLVILGLLLLALLSALFVPLRYSGRAQKEGEVMEASLRVSWLLHLIHFTLGWREGKLDWNLRIFGISLKKLGKLLERRQRRDKAKAPGEGRRETEEPESVREEKPEPRAEEKEPGQLSRAAAETQKPPQEDMEAPRSLQEDAEAPRSSQEDAKTPQLEEGFRPASLPGPTISFWERIAGALRAALGAVKGFFVKIWRGIRWILGLPGRIFRGVKKICFTIQGMCDKIEKWKRFVREEDTREAFRLVKRSIGGALRHVLPRRIRGRLLFGFEDPSQTGRLLAALSPFYPVYAKSLALTPAFDRAVLEGRISFRGRIYGVFFVKTALNIWMDKHVKKTVKRFRQVSSL